MLLNDNIDDDDDDNDDDRAEVAEAQMMKTGDFSAPAKEDWGAEGGVEDWSADGQPGAPAPAPAAIAAPTAGYQVQYCTVYSIVLYSLQSLLVS